MLLIYRYNSKIKKKVPIYIFKKSLTYSKTIECKKVKYKTLVAHVKQKSKLDF